MILFGGAERLNYRLNDTFMLDLDSLRWTMLTCSGDVPQGRFAHSMNIIGDRIVVYGGTDRSVCFNDMNVLDVRLRQWSGLRYVRGLECPPGRYFHASAMNQKNGVFYLWGGKSSTSEQTRLGDLWTLSFQEYVKTSHSKIACTLADDLLRLLHKQQLCDLALVSKSKEEVFAHKLLAKARSPVLSELIDKQSSRVDSPVPMEVDEEVSELECEDDQSQCVKIQLDYPTSTLKLLLQFLYGDMIPEGSPDNLVEFVHLMALSCELELPRLRRLCEVRVSDCLHDPRRAESLITYLKEFQYRIPSLEVFVLTFLNIHFGMRPALEEMHKSPWPVSGQIHIPDGTLSQDLLKLRFISETARLNLSYDFLFCFGPETQISAHLVMLAARSEYFGSFSFRRGMSEAKSRRCSLPEDQSPISAPAFVFLLDFLYGGVPVLDRLTESMAREFLESDAVNYFGLSNDALERASVQMINGSRGPKLAQTKSLVDEGSVCIIQ